VHSDTRSSSCHCVQQVKRESRVHYITVRVVGLDGRPKPRARVIIDLDSFFGGQSAVAYTNNHGEAEIELEAGAPIIIYVDGQVVKRNQQTRSHFTVTG
jgi:hypothetical protein